MRPVRHRRCTNTDTPVSITDTISVEEYKILEHAPAKIFKLLQGSIIRTAAVLKWLENRRREEVYTRHTC